MQSLEEIQSIHKLVNAGEFSNILSHLEKLLQSECPAELAMKTLVIVSQSLSKPDYLSISQENFKIIQQLVHQCCMCIQYDAKYNKKLLTCLYYIFKYFVQQDELQNALVLKTYIISTTRNGVSDDEALQNIYYSCYYLVHSTLMDKMKSMQTLPTKLYYKELLDILGSALEILACCGTKHLNIILTNSVQIEALLNKSRQDDFLKDKMRFQFNVLDIIRGIFDSGIINSICDSVYQSYLVLISTMLSNSIDKRRFDEIVQILGKVASPIQAMNKVQYNCILCYKQILEVFLNPNLNYSVTMLEECNATLERLVKHIGKSTNLVIMCSHLTTLCTHLQHYYAEMKIKWSMSIHEQIYRIFFNLALVLQEGKHECVSSSGANCPLQKELQKSVRMYVLIMQLLSNVEEHEIESVISHHIVAQEFAIKFMRVMKDEGCHFWKEIWTTVAITSFNIGCELQANRKLYQSVTFFSNFCRAFLAMEGIQESYITIKDGLFRGLQGVTRGCMDQKNYREALLPCAIALVLLPNRYKDIMAMWVVVKKNAITSGFHTHIQECTLFHILTEDEHKIKAMLPTIRLENADICQMLVWELEAYSSTRVSLWEATYAAGAALRSLSPDCLLLGKGLENLLLDMWKQPNMELSREAVGICGEIIAVLHDEIQVSHGERRQEILATVGHMHYYNFLHHLKLTRDKQKREVESLKVFPYKVELTPGEEDPSDCHSVCDVTPAYDGLTVDKEAEILSMMAQAVDAWSLFLNGILICIPDMRTAMINNILPRLETIAHTYALYGCEISRLNVWMLYYNFSEAINSESDVLLALSYLLEASDENFCSEYLRRAETIAHDLEVNLSTDKYEKLPLLLTYWINRSEHCLKTGKYDEGLQLLLKMKSDAICMCPRFDMVTYARNKLLLSRYLCLSSSSNVHEEYNDINALIAVGIAFGVVQKQFKEGKATISPCENSQLLSLTMDISEWIGELYLHLKMPRDVRCYVKSQLILAQMLALPTRVAQFLSKLAQVDLLCSNVLDCQVKLHGMGSILQQINPTTLASSAVEEKHEEVALDPCTLLQLENLDLEDDIRSQALDRRGVHWNNSPKASPVLHRKLFKLPDFVCHSKDCKCLPCNSLLIQNLMMESTHIEAQLHALEGNNKHAYNYFEGGMQLSRILQRFQRKLVSSLSLNGITSAFSPLQDAFNISFCRFLFFHAEFSALHCKYKNAEKLNGYAWDVVKKLKAGNLHLEQEILEQKFCFTLLSFDESASKILDPPMSAVTPGTVPTDLSDVRTPYNKTNIVPRPALFTTIQELQDKYGSPPKRDIPSIVVNLFSSNDKDSHQIKIKNPKSLKGRGKALSSKSSKTVSQNVQAEFSKPKKCDKSYKESTGQVHVVSSGRSLSSLISMHSNSSGSNQGVGEHLKDFSLSDNVFESPFPDKKSSGTEFSDVFLTKTTRVYDTQIAGSSSNKSSLKDDCPGKTNKEVGLPSYILKSPTTLNGQDLINTDILVKHTKKLIIDDSSNSSVMSTSSSDDIFSNKKSESNKDNKCNKYHEQKVPRNKTDVNPTKSKTQLPLRSISKSCVGRGNRRFIKEPLSPICTINDVTTRNNTSKKNAKLLQDPTEPERGHGCPLSDDAENINPVISEMSRDKPKKMPTRCRRKIVSSDSSTESPSNISIKLTPVLSRREKTTKKIIIEETFNENETDLVENSATGSVLKVVKGKHTSVSSCRGRRTQPLNETLNTMSTRRLINKVLFCSPSSSESSVGADEGVTPANGFKIKAKRERTTAEGELQQRTGRRYMPKVSLSSTDSSGKEHSPVEIPSQAKPCSTRKKEATSITKRKTKRCPYIL